MNRWTRIGLAAALIGLAFSAQAEPRTLNDKVFSESQADSGEALYKEHCLACHDKKYFRPVLNRWEGQSLGIFYTIMITSMPESNPGALPLEEYADILAYILSLSRYSAGDEPLASDPDALADITIAKRKR